MVCQQQSPLLTPGHWLSAGVLCINVIPVWAQTLLLSVLLLFVIVKTFGKAVRQWQAEQKHQQKQLRQQSSAPRDTDHDVEHAEALLSEPEDSVESESSYNLKERPIDAHFAIHEEVFHPKHHKHLVAHKSRSGVTSLSIPRSIRTLATRGATSSLPGLSCR